MFAKDKELLTNAFKIHYTMRIQPEDQNSGGFYVALFRKLKKVVFKKGGGTFSELTADAQATPQTGQPAEDISEKGEPSLEKPSQKVKLNTGELHDVSKTQEAPKAAEPTPQGKKGREPKMKSDYFSFLPKHAAEWESIREMYGLKEEFSKNLYLSLEGTNKVYFVNDGIHEFLKCDKLNLLKRINLGIRAFQRCKNKHNGNNIVFRITQEGLQTLFHSFNKRKLRVALPTLLFLMRHQTIKHADVPQDQVELQEIIKNTNLGYFAIYVQDEQGNILELACLLKFATSLSLMASDEMIQGLKVKYDKDFMDEPTHRPKPSKAKEDA